MSTGLEAQSGRGAGAAWLSSAEVDLLTTFAEVALPFPLRVTPKGLTGADRRAEFAAARAALVSSGLADNQGPRGVAADFVHLLRNGTGTLDVLIARRDHVLGVVVLAQRSEALLVAQELRGGSGRIQFSALSVHDAIDQVCGWVPALGPAMTSPFSLPRQSISDVHKAMLARPADSPLTSDQFDALLRANGIDDQLGRRMITHLQPVLGNGQAGTAVRTGYAGEWSRVGDELRWLDTARGRLRLAGGDRGDWMSVNPFAPDELRTEIRRLASDLWF